MNQHRKRPVRIYPREIHPDYLAFLSPDQMPRNRNRPPQMQRAFTNYRVQIFALLVITLGTTCIFGTIKAASALRPSVNNDDQELQGHHTIRNHSDEEKLIQLSEALAILVTVVKRHETVLTTTYPQRNQALPESFHNMNLIPFLSSKEISLTTPAIPITVNVSNARLRSGPSSSFPVVVTLEKNTDLLATQVKDGWVLVTSPKGKDAWIKKELIAVKTLG